MPVKPNPAFIRQVGERIRLLRERAGLSLDDVAWPIDIEKSTLSRIERGERAPSIELLSRLAEQMKVVVADFVSVGDDPRSRLQRATFGVDATVLKKMLEKLPPPR